MKLESGETTLHVDLDKCEEADPCAYDHTCRIHKIRWFLRVAGLFAKDEKAAEEIEK